MSPEQIETTARFPRNDTNYNKIGIFAQRAKSRPNRIGVSRCKILDVKGLTITVQALDAIDPLSSTIIFTCWFFSMRRTLMWRALLCVS